MKGSKKGPPKNAWWLGPDRVKHKIDNTIKAINTNVVNTLTSTTLNCNNFIGNPYKHHHAYVIVDTGATQKYIRSQTICTKKVNISNIPQVLLPYGSVMQATHMEDIHLVPLLSTRDNTQQISPHLKPGALISIGQICDDVCIATFTSKDMKVVKQGKIFLEGHREGAVGMWKVNLTNKSPHNPPHTHQSANNLVEKRRKSYPAQWYHVTLFRPVT